MTSVMADPLTVKDLKPRDLAELHRLLIRASAGTGKTYQLTGRLLRLLLHGSPADSIIATTFTRKAAGEILRRLFESLAHAAVDDSQRSVSQLAAQTVTPELTRAQCAEMVRSLLRDVHRLKILTLDSLFSQLARAQTYELGIPPGWHLSDEIEDSLISEAAVDRLLSELDHIELLNLMAQLGKGDLKRSVRTEMLRVIADGYQVSRGCQAAAWDRLQVPSAPDELTMNRALRVLSESAIGHKSVDDNLHKLAEQVELGQWDALAGKKLMVDAQQCPPGGVFTYYRKQLTPEIVAALKVVVEALRTHLLSLLKMQTVATGSVIQQYESQVMALKQALAAYSFDDIAYRLAVTMQSQDAAQAEAGLDAKIEHLLLDEFQDTSPVQWSVLKPIAMAALQPSTSGSFFCVGDTKQAIYGWRGGVAAIFDTVKRQIRGLEERQQNASYRSSPVITGFVNQVFQNLHRHPVASTAPETALSGSAPTLGNDAALAAAIHRFSGQFPAHSTARSELTGHVAIRTSLSGDGEESRKALHLRYVAEEIAKLSSQSSSHSIGVLTRTNESVAWLIQWLRILQIDVSQEGGNPLVDSAAVEMVLSVLMMAEHPGDRRWAFHVAHSPLANWLGIERFNQTGQAESMIRQLIESLGIAQTVERLVAELVKACDASEAIRLRQLVYLAQQYESSPGARISNFVHVVRNRRVEKPRPAQVRVMTIHQAKGLEFDSVVLPEVDSELIRPPGGVIARRDEIDGPPSALLRYCGQDQWSLLPSDWQQTFSDVVVGRYLEALCLFYVAVTRPRRALYVYTPPANKAQPEKKNIASLLYYACGSTVDASLPGETWFECGDSQWYLADRLSPGQE